MVQVEDVVVGQRRRCARRCRRRRPGRRSPRSCRRFAGPSPLSSAARRRGRAAGDRARAARASVAASGTPSSQFVHSRNRSIGRGRAPSSPSSSASSARMPRCVWPSSARSSAPCSADVFCAGSARRPGSPTSSQPGIAVRSAAICAACTCPARRASRAVCTSSRRAVTAGSPGRRGPAARTSCSRTRRRRRRRRPPGGGNGSPAAAPPAPASGRARRGRDAEAEEDQLRRERAAEGRVLAVDCRIVHVRDVAPDVGAVRRSASGRRSCSGTGGTARCAARPRARRRASDRTGG